MIQNPIGKTLQVYIHPIGYLYHSTLQYDMMIYIIPYIFKTPRYTKPYNNESTGFLNTGHVVVHGISPCLSMHRRFRHLNCRTLYGFDRQG